MQNNTEAIVETLAELIRLVDRSNVGKSAARKNGRHAEGQAGGKRKTYQHVS